MKRRISLWAFIGFAVAFVWFLVGLFTWPNYNLGRWTIVAVTAPASLVGRTMPLAYTLAYYCFILLNAAIHALVGLAAEVLRRPLARHSSS